MGLGANPNGSHNWESPGFICGLGEALKVPGYSPKASSHVGNSVLVFSLMERRKVLAFTSFLTSCLLALTLLPTISAADTLPPPTNPGPAGAPGPSISPPMIQLLLKMRVRYYEA